MHNSLVLTLYFFVHFEAGVTAQCLATSSSHCTRYTRETRGRLSGIRIAFGWWVQAANLFISTFCVRGLVYTQHLWIQVDCLFISVSFCDQLYL